MPKVSVLFPVYNTEEKYLRAAIDSILEQTFTDFELIIINDASTDKNVEKVVISYQDKRIRYSVNPTNQGITKTRNTLISMAKGDYLAVMDHDDISLPNRFVKQVSMLDDNPDIGVVSSSYTKIDKNGNCRKWDKHSISRRFNKSNIIQNKLGDAIIYKNNFVNDDQLKLSLFRNCALCHPAAMIRKSVLINNNIFYEEEFTPVEDYALWCRLMPYTKFYNIPEVLFQYRSHGKNTSKTQDSKVRIGLLAIQAFVKMENPLLYQKHLLLSTHTTITRLFGVIPFLKFVAKSHRTKVYLFNIIPIFYYKKLSD